MSESYWLKVLDERLSRRRALVIGGTAAASAAFLAACGGSDSGGSGGGSGAGSSGKITQPVDTTKSAKRGGTMKDRTFGDPPSLDITSAATTHNSVGPMVYSSLVKIKPGHLKPTENELTGDVAESWEWAPDGSQVTLKLRQGMKWHNKAPVNGRALGMADVLFSWNRFAAKSTNRAAIANSVDPNAPVLSITSTDDKTLVIKLKEPVVYALALFSENLAGRMLIVPKEADGDLDLRKDMIGSGPFSLASYTPSVGFTLKRHSDYYDQDYALVDQISLPIVSEYASALSQFKGGNIYSMGSGGNTPKVKPEDILPTKQDVPDLQIYPGDLASIGPRLAFGFIPGSPFQDERVRQAFSLSYDRDLFLDTFANVSKFGSEGLPLTVRWSTSLEATYEGWWLDPKSKDFGPNGKYYNHDLAEAKKLLAAAGFANGLKDVASSYITTNELGDLPRQAEVINGMLGENGSGIKAHPVDYATEYMSKYRDVKGQFAGYLFKASGGSLGKGDAVGSMSAEYLTHGGSTFFGFDAAGKGDGAGDPQLEAMLAKAKVETDTEKRKALIYDVQRYLAKAMYAILPPGATSGLTMAWPAIGNFRVYQGGFQLNYGLWVDETKAPIKKT